VSSLPDDARLAGIEMGSILAVKKTSKTALSRCERGKEEYCLKMETLPKAPPPKGEVDVLSLGAD
jgi:hypothetical protein